MSIYEQLGVRPVINATCHWTVYGGSVMWPEVSAAMTAARQHCVDLRQLLDRASAIISGHTHAEASYVVSGCAAALQIGAAAIMTGHDPVLMAQLPQPDATRKHEFIARRFARRQAPDGRAYTHWGYAHAVRGAGGVLREIGDASGATAEQFLAAITRRTAGVYWVSDGLEPGLQLAEVIGLAHAHGLPVLVDASNTLPPPENLHRFIDLGADLVAFSGGKGLRGPQGSGILTGRADLIAAARQQGAPLQGIGRPLKVSKEEIVGLLTALEIWTARDHAADLRDAQARTARLVAALADLPGVQATARFPDHLGRPYPTAFIRLDPATGLTVAAVIEQLLAGEPSVAVMHFDDPQILRVDVRVLSEAETTIVTDRLRQVLSPVTVGPQ